MSILLFLYFVMATPCSSFIPLLGRPSSHLAPLSKLGVVPHHETHGHTHARTHPRVRLPLSFPLPHDVCDNPRRASLAGTCDGCSTTAPLQLCIAAGLSMRERRVAAACVSLSPSSRDASRYTRARRAVGPFYVCCAFRFASPAFTSRCVPHQTSTSPPLSIAIRRLRPADLSLLHFLQHFLATHTHSHNRSHTQPAPVQSS